MTKLIIKLKNTLWKDGKKARVIESICKPSGKDLVSKVCKDFSKFSCKNPNSPIRKWPKDMEERSTQGTYIY